MVCSLVQVEIWSKTPRYLPNWDYLTPISVTRDIEVDLQGLLSDCALAPDALAGATICWHSTRTNLRGAIEVTALNDGPNTVTGVIDGTLLGGRLTLDTKVVLMRPGSGSAPMAPRRPGSTLWAKTTRFDLEGTDARFPVLPLSFSASGIAGGRKGAWALVVENPDLSSLAVGSLRLYLNTDHPAIGSLLDSADSPENRWVQEFLRYDTARQLVTAALANDELRTGIEYDSGYAADEGVWSFMSQSSCPTCPFGGGRTGTSGRTTSGSSGGRGMSSVASTACRPFPFGAGTEDPTARLTEDETVAILERPTIGGDPRVARGIAVRHLAISDLEPGIRRTTLMREVMKRIRRLTPIVTLAALSDQDLEDLVSDVFCTAVSSLKTDTAVMPS